MRCAARRLALAICLLQAAAANAADSEDVERPQDPTLSFSDRSSVAWVLVPVTVRSATGQVRDLRLKDFQLRVDGREVAIMSFEAGPDAPVRLIYLQDLSGSMANAGKLEASRDVLRCFLAQTRPGDELALMTFASGETRFEIPFTSDTSRLEKALAGWRGHGTTALHDAVARLPELRAGGGPLGLKRAAVLVTDGGDNASTVTPERARAIVREAELPVYVLDLRTHEPTHPEPDSFAYLLRLLAAATGGGYQGVVGTDMTPACASITETLRFQYVLGFQTRDTGGPKYHKIEVEVETTGKVEVSHRRGYFGLPAPGSR